jgi:phosphotriesterase-related protein
MRIARREFLGGWAASALAAAEASVLVHEHVLVDFIGADQIAPGRYDPEEAFRVARPRLEEIARLGCRRLLECTPSFLGRDAKLMARLADSTGLEIWINTGIYGAGAHKYVPAFAREASAEQLAKRWIAEARQGVDGIKPRFIKTGVNGGPLDALDRKLVRAAAIASRETGLTIASHTGNGAAALEEIDIVVSEKVSPSKFVWVHAQSEKDSAIHEKAARSGAWVEFDGIGPKSVDRHLECVRNMAARGLLGKVLISQDSGWYRVGEPGGGDYRGYTGIYTDFLPKLDPAWVRPLMWDNPKKAFG